MTTRPTSEPIQRGRAALESLYNSAVSVMEQAQNLVQLTEPETPERARGIPPAKRKTPAGTRTVAPVFGVAELGRIVDGAWIEWRAATLMACESEPLRKTVGEAITEVIQAGRDLVNASVRAQRPTDALWGNAFNRLNTVTLELQGLMRLVPTGAGPVSPEHLLMLARRLTDQSRKVRQPDDYGHEQWMGVPASAEATWRKHSWGDELRDCRKHDASWLDPSWIESATYTAEHQRALVTLFELHVAARLLENVPAAADVRAALAIVAKQPYYRLTMQDEPVKTLPTNRKAKKSRPVLPWKAVWRPIPPSPLRGLLTACQEYAAKLAAVPRRKSSAKMSKGEANAIAQQILKTDKSFARKGSREWAAQIGCSLGLIPQLPLWKAIQEQLKRDRPPSAPKTVGLTRKLSANLDQRGKIGRHIATTPAKTELDRLIEESEADYEPSPLVDDPPGRARARRQDP